MAKFKTVGVLTGGGDCPGLNAVIRSVARNCFKHGMKVWGVQNGFSGLVENQFIELNDNVISGILHRGGTILGTTNRDNPFNYAVEENGKYVYYDKSQEVLKNLKNKNIEAMIIIGGDGSLVISGQLSKLGVPVVAVPKTIDNDIPYTERTFGFDTAVACASEALDRLHTTAEAHHRVMVLEVMGRYAGWIAVHSGIAGGADVILIPEVPYKMDSIIEKINSRKKDGKLFSLVVASEGAYPVDGEQSIARIVENSAEKIRLGGIGQKLAQQIEDITGIESRCTTLGHLQRGGSPTAFDRILSTRYGVAAADAVARGEVDCMVALQKNEIVCVPIVDVVGKPSNVTPEFLEIGRSIGINFGD